MVEAKTATVAARVQRRAMTVEVPSATATEIRKICNATGMNQGRLKDLVAKKAFESVNGQVLDLVQEYLKRAVNS